MAQLLSPGVQVSVIDESQYGPAGLGTIPFIVIVTQSNKPLPSGDGIAPGTLPENAGVLYQIASQRELVQTFGEPVFYQEGGTSKHAYELNEYGLLTAYQYLGSAGPVYVLRADIDLSELEPSEFEPKGPAYNGTYWLDLSETQFGLFRSNGNENPGRAWISQSVKVIETENNTDNNDVPLSSFGEDGDYAIVAYRADNVVYEKLNGSWYPVGSADWKAANPVVVTGTDVADISNAISDVNLSFEINGVEVSPFTSTTLSDIADDINNTTIDGIVASVVGNALRLTNTLGEDITISGAAAVELGFDETTYKGNQVFYGTHTQYPVGSVEGDLWFKTTSPNSGADWVVKLYNADTAQWTKLDAPLFADDNAANAALGTNIAAGTIYVKYNVYDSVPAQGSFIIKRWNGSTWQPLVYEASSEEPYTEPQEGTLWFNNDLFVDIMVSDGQKWLGYNNYYPGREIILSASAPILQSDGSLLQDDDLWIDTSDMRNYPTIYRFNATSREWEQVDNTDQTTPFGIVFSDARWTSGPDEITVGSTTYNAYSQEKEALMYSNYVDPDAPNPLNYPAGVLLFNTRLSTNSVLEWRPNHLEEYVGETYEVGSAVFGGAVTSAGRWVNITEFQTTDLDSSGKDSFGVAYFGYKAQRAVITKKIKEALQANQDVRAENVYFNLLTCPGFPEVMEELIQLNIDKKEIGFVIGDTPARLKPSTTEFQNWATNASGQPVTNEDGLATQDYAFSALYYPWGYSTNLDGQSVMIPPSSIALLTYSYNDQVGYPWMAPAGDTRGIVLNASSVGYLTDEEEFKTVMLNESQRDVLYVNRINPISYTNNGLIVRGQKTLHNQASALDRVNVARLTCYLRYHCDLIAKPFLFEPNDDYTREQVRLTFSRFLDNLMSLRAIGDYVVVCDSSNNTPDRIDRNELWIDISVEPIKAIEFIYIPIRLKNTGEI